METFISKTAQGRVSLIFIFLFIFLKLSYSAGFVTIENGEFIRNEKPYHIQSTSMYPWHSKDTVWIKESIKLAYDHGFNSIRSVQHFYDTRQEAYDNPDALLVDKIQFSDDIWLRNDLLLRECAKYGMTVHFELSQFYSGTTKKNKLANGNVIGGSVLGVAGFRPYDLDEGSKQLISELYDYALNRENTFTGVKYKDDPTIAMWSVIGEHMPFPSIDDGYRGGPSEKIYDLIMFIADYLDKNAPNHLVSADGFIHLSGESGGVPRNESGQPDSVHYDVWRSDLIDCGGIHVYGGKDGKFDISDWPLQEWKNVPDHAKVIKDLGKPFMLETGVPYKKNYLESGLQTEDTYLTMFDHILNTIKTLELDGMLFWNWNNNNNGFDLYPGVSNFQDDLLDVLTEYDDYFTSAEILVETAIHENNSVSSLNKNTFSEIEILRFGDMLQFKTTNKRYENIPISLYSISGEIVSKKRDIKSGISLKGLSSGLYFVKIGNTFNLMRRVILK